MDIFEFALKMEMESENYYREQAKMTKFDDLRIILENLAAAEARHYKIVEALRQQNNESLPDDQRLAEVKNIFESYIKDAKDLRNAISIEKVQWKILF